eukprot:scaffold92222_cov67-Phaeocystis_antarctica.AAC.1
MALYPFLNTSTQRRIPVAPTSRCAHHEVTQGDGAQCAHRRGDDTADVALLASPECVIKKDSGSEKVQQK